MGGPVALFQILHLSREALNFKADLKPHDVMETTKSNQLRYQQISHGPSPVWFNAPVSGSLKVPDSSVQTNTGAQLSYRGLRDETDVRRTKCPEKDLHS